MHCYTHYSISWIYRFFLCGLLICAYSQLNAQSGQWIGFESVPSSQYGVYAFRRTVNLDQLPASLVIRITADNRYKLFINGKFVSLGPARGTLEHWQVDRVDIAPFLHKGANVIAVQVWNSGKLSPRAQLSAHAAFQLSAPDSFAFFSTNASWKTAQLTAYHPIKVVNTVDVRGGFLAGHTDSVVCNPLLSQWLLVDYNDDSWKSAEVYYNQKAQQAPWQTEDRSIPLLEHKIERFSTIRVQKGVKRNEKIECYKNKKWTISANRKVSILLDMGRLTVGYPVIKFKGGKGSSIKIGYAEALFEAGQRDNQGKLIGEGQYKGHRDSINGKEFVGYYDKLMPDGFSYTFSPLWFRTFRYVKLDIETSNKSLEITDFYNLFTAYPFEENARFQTPDSSLTRIWDVAWRTARLCANEIYMDCPYYEQLQYIGDTRIQSLVSLYVSGDDRLMRQALQQFYQSINAEGLTQAAYPSQGRSIIPSFSLFWVGMLYDYYMHRPDTTFVNSMVDGACKVLDWHTRFINDQTGFPSAMPYWHFVDWPTQWAWDPKKNTGGIPEGVAEGKSAILALQIAYTLDQACEMLSGLGYQQQADVYRQTSAHIKNKVFETCWNENKGLFSDTPDGNSFSQHLNALALLTGLVNEAQKGEFIEKVLLDSSLIQCTVYYRFYLNRALQEAGRGDLFTSSLKPWTDMLALGLTTFAEKPEPTRSDCHAWSASPMYEFLALVCGIRPAEAGFKSVLIEPNPGLLNHIDARMPHPAGFIRFSYEKNNEVITIHCDLPVGLSGILLFNNAELPLVSGSNRFTF